MKPQFKISPFSQYVLRTPLFPLSFYLDLLKNYNSGKSIAIYQNALVKEALSMASPELINELNKWESFKADSFNKKKSALEFTLLKYIARISSRCTPFGLFAGCSVGKINTETNIILDLPKKYKRFTQFDMQFWVALLQNIARQKKVISRLKYYPNSSIYEFGDFYRYIEYKYVKNKREHSITSLRKSDALKEIMLQTKLGLTIDDIVSILADNDSEKREAYEFIMHLIDFQFLVSEIDATVTSNNEFERVLAIFKNVPDLKKEYRFLETINKQILDLDISLIPTKNQYEKIKEKILEEGFEYDEKYLFQTDLTATTISNSLNAIIIKKAAKGLCFLNGIQPKKESNQLNAFAKAFSKRYESQEMPLMVILDVESGLGYPINHDMNDSHEILEAFSFKQKKDKNENQVWTSYDSILEKKLQECLSKKQIKIELSESDFPDFDANFDDAPSTFSALIEVYHNEKLSIESSGNISATKFLGRFCNGNSEIHKLTQEIIQKEQNYYHDKILAEIVHIPQSRTGNILRRPVLRNYEIAYLANSGVEKKNTIDLNDLFVSIRNDKIILHSKKHDKEVIPCLSNAHNFYNNSLPVYHFLCDLQAQNTKPIYSFNWGVLESHYNYFPRVEYNEIILSKAKWIIAKEEVASFLKLSGKDLFEAFSNWRISKDIPCLVNWVNSDNTLLLDFQTEIGIQLFLKSVRNRDKIVLEEFLFTDESIVKNIAGKGFNNQFIVSFFKQQS
ncbi:lantibiotic dehydratase family protein [Flavobacterium humidisoli]|uniref:Lantibiotic dehydratase family protein n=1 Tax=Flavobacterium humidisoli TaxID=2937442 RepID=A0ABY4LV98_9FLAO|nr:lantibiotic dehydratase family protein [Flavobacterium humidisoli]UPZ17010.1 lantibiotic dehydratase family protein [Flavobacterium humidisoli]